MVERVVDQLTIGPEQTVLERQPDLVGTARQPQPARVVLIARLAFGLTQEEAGEPAIDVLGREIDHMIVIPEQGLGLTRVEGIREELRIVVVAALTRADELLRVPVVLGSLIAAMAMDGEVRRTEADVIGRQFIAQTHQNRRALARDERRPGRERRGPDAIDVHVSPDARGRQVGMEAMIALARRQFVEHGVGRDHPRGRERRRRADRRGDRELLDERPQERTREGGGGIEGRSVVGQRPLGDQQRSARHETCAQHEITA